MFSKFKNYTGLSQHSKKKYGKASIANVCILSLIICTFLLSRIQHYAMFHLENANLLTRTYANKILADQETNPWVYVINQFDLCTTTEHKSKEIDLIIMIVSGIDSYTERNAIRQSYASVSRNNTSNVRHIFFIGSNGNENQTREITQENSIHHDIVQIDIIDTYATLTLKVVAGINWIVRYCSNAKYLIKCDTDTLLNIHKILSMINNPSFSLQNSIGGKEVLPGTNPYRSIFSKWYLPELEYQDNSFPNYISGAAYIMDLNVARDIMRVSVNVPFIRIEDAYLGLCIYKLKYKVVNIPEFKVLDSGRCHLSRAMVCHEINPDLLISYWNSIQTERAK